MKDDRIARSIEEKMDGKVVGMEAAKAPMEEAKRNILGTKDMGDYILESRKVFRKGMKEVGYWSLKMPKTMAAAESIYGSACFLKAGIATLRTDGDDRIEKGQKPASEESKLKSDIKGASPEAMEAIKAMLAEDAAKRISAKEGKS